VAELALPTLLSATLVAFTVEFDNEAEHRLPHWTTAEGREAKAAGATWLVSQVMWDNVMRYVDAEGITVGELRARARTERLQLDGLRRWGYVSLSPGPSGRVTKPYPDDVMVRPKAAGRRAQEIWRPLAAEIEQRWRQRYGADDMAVMRRSLQAVVDRLDGNLPSYLPLVYPTQNGRAEPQPAGAVRGPGIGDRGGISPSLSELLSQVLLAFTLDFETRSKISLVVCANTLRVLDAAGLRVRDLPALTGISKEGNAMALGYLVRIECAVEESDGRIRMARLTPKGEKAQAKYLRALGDTEAEWRHRFGENLLGGMRSRLSRLVGPEPKRPVSPLFEALVPYPDGWRAKHRPPETLPHYPMPLHRGGYPDGC
jgi:hypothetical protein